MARLGLALLWLTVTATYLACVLIVIVAASGRWKEIQRIGAATVLTLMYAGFLIHFYLQNFIKRA